MGKYSECVCKNFMLYERCVYYVNNIKDKSKFLYLIDNFMLLQIWTPDLTVYNSAEAQIIDHFAKTNKIIYSNGNVLWVSINRRIFGHTT